MGVRRRARATALQILYQLDLHESPGAPPATGEAAERPRHTVDVEQGIADFLSTYPEQNKQVRSYAEEIVRGVRSHLVELDERIQATSHHWRVDRMAAVDRNLLRLATWELVYRAEVPRNVVLNEAIELAKRYGDHESRAFVNGILDKLHVE